MAWIEVTDPMGRSVYLCVGQLVRIRPCVAGVDVPAADARAAHDHNAGDLASAKSIVDLATGMQAVRETQKEILDRIKVAEKEEDDEKTVSA